MLPAVFAAATPSKGLSQASKWECVWHRKWGLSVSKPALPEKGVLFLGGHPNMTKKLRRKFPKWSFITDDQFKRFPVINETIVFYWTGHSSHKLMRNIYSKLPENTTILYVSATNLQLLISEMENDYQSLGH
jgi:hypothetical protein